MDFGASSGALLDSVVLGISTVLENGKIENRKWQIEVFKWKMPLKKQCLTARKGIDYCGTADDQVCNHVNEILVICLPPIIITIRGSLYPNPAFTDLYSSCIYQLYVLSHLDMLDYYHYSVMCNPWPCTFLFPAIRADYKRF